ncbi:peptidoglycan D,D-transpeptidase FtsI family protein [Fretibacterium fastidiosum]|uniref:peptidoglycan D,D-transpeptidase FtsI family protein n=1 Tax=Fretibacterium fastidiosum TaxID=651822 RepID=UPI000319E407|nr:penicillin-binding protein 2 [Fretibacterium fastidiosum]
MRKRHLISPWFPFAVLYLLMGGALIERHCFPSPRIIQQSQHQYWRRVPMRADRGIIQDERENALVISEPVSSFAVDPSLLTSDEALALQGALSEDLLARLAQAGDSQFMWLRRKVSPKEGADLRALNLRALLDIGEQDRRYPNQSLLAHVLGFCDIDNRGLAGIEQAWDSTLYNPPGYRILVRRPGAQSAVLVNDVSKQRRTTPVVTLTVDSRMQYVVEKHLFKTAKDNGAKWAAAVCMDPWTGAILSMASWPPFDPGDRRSLASEALSNNAISRGYEPGSTLKPLVMGIALENGWARTNETFNCPARLKVADGYVAEAASKAMGRIDTAHLIIKSSNVGMAQIGIRAEKAKMYESLRAMGFGQESDIELPAVAEGIVPFPEQWRGVVPANIAIGQGLAVTPLQLINATAAIVNGGRLMSPYIVKKATNSMGETVYEGSPLVLREVLTPETARWLRKAMRDAVVEGTGRRAETKVTRLAGKTGTAQVPEGGKYSRHRYVASFIGFWPYEDPKYLMLLVIGEPAGGRYYGGELAAPPFRAIVEEMAELEYYAQKKGSL